MPVPGPPAALWAVALIAWALDAAVLGEAVRYVAARWVPSWRAGEPIERFLLDFYLGGAALYLVAAVPVGAFGRAVVDGLPLVAGVGLLGVVLVRGRPFGRARVEALVARLRSPAPLLAIATAVGLLAIEVASATAAGTGNTYDSSLLTTYTALLLQHGTLPLSFRPYASPMILYPQGTTAWLGGAQLLFGLPPARTALLVTPLFLALVPLSGYVFGRRILGSDRAGAAFALSLGWLGPATRSLVGGSNDFAFAFPLVLLLAAPTILPTGDRLPAWGDVVGVGLLVGYSAAMNPVGAEWWFPTVLLLGLVPWRGSLRRAAGWVGRWSASLAAGLVPVAPTLYVLVRGLGSPGFVPGAAAPPTAAPVGISVAQLIGSIDPFLFRPSDLELSPIPLVRAELALLLVAGVAILLFAGRPSRAAPGAPSFARWALVAGAVIVAELGGLAAAGAGWPVARSLANLSSAAELSVWIFTVFGLVAAIPLVVLFDRLAAPPPSPAPAPARPSSRFRRGWARTGGGAGSAPIAALAVSLAVLAPGVILSATALPPVLGSFYDDFGRVSPADFALLACAGANVPPGSRVLVAPGSAAEFLPGYARGITLLYPLVPNWQWESADYRLVVAELSNATLNASGRSALAALDVGFIAVTMNNTNLWPAFSPRPLLADPSDFAEVFAEGDAYLFSTDPAAPAFPCG